MKRLAQSSSKVPSESRPQPSPLVPGGRSSRSRSPIEAFTMPDRGVHDARSRCSRWAETRTSGNAGLGLAARCQVDFGLARIRRVPCEGSGAAGSDRIVAARAQRAAPRVRSAPILRCAGASVTGEPQQRAACRRGSAVGLPREEVAERRYGAEPDTFVPSGRAETRARWCPLVPAHAALAGDRPASAPLAGLWQSVREVDGWPARPFCPPVGKGVPREGNGLSSPLSPGP